MFLLYLCSFLVILGYDLYQPNKVDMYQPNKVAKLWLRMMFYNCL